MPNLYYIYIAILCLTTLIGLVRFKHLTPELRLMLFLTFFSLPIELAKKFSDFRGELDHTYSIIEIAIISYYYYRLAYNKKVTLAIIAMCAVLFVAIFAQPDYFGSSVFYDKLAAQIAICLFVIQYFTDLIRRPMTHPLNRDGDFWINVGNIMFFSGTLFYFAIKSADIHIQDDVLIKIRYINHFLNLFLYIAYAIGFVLENRKKSQGNKVFLGKSMAL